MLRARIMDEVSKTKLVNFASRLDDETRAQAERTASMPFVRHIWL